MKREKLYWLPNLLTTMTLICGFYAIVLAMRGNSQSAVQAVIAAMLFDFLDGWVARKTNTVSVFGKEYDSLCDMVAFGLSPALITYHCLLMEWHQVAWIIPAIYSSAVAMRLAKFNSKESSNAAFEGLPCTAAAPLVVLSCYFIDIHNVPSDLAYLSLSLVILLTATMMNVDVKYRSFKQNKKMLHVGRLYIVAALILASCVFWPFATLYGVLVMYLFSPIMMCRQRVMKWCGKAFSLN